MSCNCEFKRYYSFNYLPVDKDKSHPFVEAPYCVNIFDVMDCSRGVELGVFTCVLTRERKRCDVEHKECCHQVFLVQEKFDVCLCLKNERILILLKGNILALFHVYHLSKVVTCRDYLL